MFRTAHKRTRGNLLLRLMVLCTSGALWAYTMASLVNREFLPYLEYESAPTYRSDLAGLHEPRLVERTICYGVQEIGRMQTLSQPEGGGFRLYSRVYIDLSGLPMFRDLQGTIDLRTETQLDDRFRLTRFDLEGKTLQWTYDLHAERRGTDLHAAYSFAGRKGEEIIRDVPDDLVLTDEMLPYSGGGKLRVGKRWKTRGIRATGSSLSIAEVFAEVMSKEPFFWKGELIDVYNVHVLDRPDPRHERTPDFDLYVDEKGRVLEQRKKLLGQLLRFVLSDERTVSSEEAAAFVQRP